MIRYLSRLAKPLYQGQRKGTLPKKAYADDRYKDLKTAEFTISYWQINIWIFIRLFGISIKNKKIKTNIANDILATEITPNNFFAHWIKEIDIKCLVDDIPILLRTNTIDIYKYSNAMLKHLPEKALKVIENNLLYSKIKVKLPDSEDRQDKQTNNANADNRTDNNINERIQKF